MTNNNAWFNAHGDEEVERLQFIAERYGCELVITGFERQRDPDSKPIFIFKCNKHKVKACPTEREFGRS